MKRWLFALLCLPMVVLAGTLPDLGDSSQSVLTPADEIRLGRRAMQDIRQQPDFDNDPELTDYLNALGYRLVANSDQNSLDFHFFAIRDSTLNAFSMPGGYVGINTGLIEATHNESELAGVMGHEIAHVTQHHVARMIEAQSRGVLPSLGMLALSILAARANPQAAGGGIMATEGLMAQKQLDFSRDNEREADRLGMRTMQRAGFDPHAMVTFFQRLQQATRLDEAHAIAYLQTHPLTSERIADMQNRVAALPPVPVSDSIEYRLLREKLRVDDLPAETAPLVILNAIQQHQFHHADSQQYALASAWLHAGQPEKAWGVWQTLAHSNVHSPVIDMLGIRIQADQRHDQAVQQMYADARLRYPDYLPLATGYATWLLNHHQPGQALSIVNTALQTSPDNALLYRLQSRGYAAEGHIFLSHYAQARSLYHDDAPQQAIAQLQIALKSTDATFYNLSEAEADMQQWQQEIQLQKGGH